MNTIATLFLALGLAPGADFRENLEKHFYHEKVKVLITRSEVANLNQTKVIAWFPQAALMFHKQLKPDGTSSEVQGAKLALSLDAKDNRENLIDVSFKRAASGYQWFIGGKEFIKGLRAEKIPLPEALRIADSSGNVAERQAMLRTTPGKDEKTGYSHAYLLQPTAVLKEDNKPSESFKSVDSSYLVEIFMEDGEKGTIDLVKSGIDPRPGDKRDIDENTSEMQKAWDAGRRRFRAHFYAFPLSFQMTYQGIGDAPNEVTQKNLSIVSHFTQNKGPGIIVIPALQPPDPKRDDEEANTVKPVQKAEATYVKWEGSKVSSASINAESFIREFVVPKLPAQLRKKGWTCLINEVDQTRQKESACKKTRDGLILELTAGEKEGSKFWITDASGAHVYEAAFVISDTEGFALRGNYYPIVDGTGRLAK